MAQGSFRPGQVAWQQLKPRTLWAASWLWAASAAIIGCMTQELKTQIVVEGKAKTKDLQRQLLEVQKLLENIGKTAQKSFAGADKAQGGFGASLKRMLGLGKAELQGRRASRGGSGRAGGSYGGGPGGGGPGGSGYPGGYGPGGPYNPSGGSRALPGVSGPAGMGAGFRALHGGPGGAVGMGAGYRDGPERGGGGGSGSGGGGAGGGGGGRRDPNKDKDKKKGSYTQGLLQGVFPQIAYIDRGKGAAAQAAGIATAKAGVSASRIPLGGSQGMRGALGGLPFVGSAFDRLANNASSATEYQRSRLGSYSQLGGLNAIDFGSDAVKYGGMGMAGAQQFAAQVGGGTAGTAQRAGKDFISTAMAAQTAFGVNPETSAAFGGAKLTGASKGPDSNSQMLVKAISQGFSLSLRGSDLQKYVQQTAEQLQHFGETGIPVDQSAKFSATKSMVGYAGMSAQRALSATEGRLDEAHSIAQNGPQTPAEMIQFTKMGYTGGAQSEMETKQKMLRQASAADNIKASMEADQESIKASGDNKVLAKQMIYKAHNGKMSMEDVDALVDKGAGANYASAQAALKANAGVSQADLLKTAADATGAAPLVTGEAKLQDQALFSQNLGSAMQTMERAANNFSTVLGDTLIPGIQRAGQAIEAFSSRIFGSSAGHILNTPQQEQH